MLIIFFLWGSFFLVIKFVYNPFVMVASSSTIFKHHQELFGHLWLDRLPKNHDSLAKATTSIGTVWGNHPSHGLTLPPICRIKINRTMAICCSYIPWNLGLKNPPAPKVLGRDLPDGTRKRLQVYLGGGAFFAQNRLFLIGRRARLKKTL